VKEQPKTVGFQLDPAHHRRLEEQGKRLNLSAGQMARELVIRALHDEGILVALNLIYEKVEGTATAEELSKFRGDVSHNMKENLMCDL